jgi:hypothetical protein
MWTNEQRRTEKEEEKNQQKEPSKSHKGTLH